jgi:hypothetical protein
MRFSRWAAVVVAAGLLLPGAPAAKAVAPLPSPVGSSIKPEDLDHFMAGLQTYQRVMDGLDSYFNASADVFRGIANEMAPLIGSLDPDDQASLAQLTSYSATTLGSLKYWAKAMRKSHVKACTWFLNEYISKWTTTRERKKMRTGVEGMRSVFLSYFDQDIVTLVEAATLLGQHDLAGFWDRLAVAEASEAFTAEGFKKPYRSLLSMS